MRIIHSSFVSVLDVRSSILHPETRAIPSPSNSRRIRHVIVRGVLQRNIIRSKTGRFTTSGSSQSRDADRRTKIQRKVVGEWILWHNQNRIQKSHFGTQCVGMGLAVRLLHDSYPFIEPYGSTPKSTGKTSLLNVFTRGFFTQV